jgi:hypothetical protein
MADIWVLASEKQALEKRVAELEQELRDQVHWKTEYLVLRDRVENPHLYDSKGCPTPEAQQGPKGGPIYSSPPLAPEDRRRVVTIRERMLELASAFYNRSKDEDFEITEQEAWARAYAELVTLYHHGMERPDLPLCLKCGGIGKAYPNETIWTDLPDYIVPGSADAKTVRKIDGKMMVPRLKSCSCENGFDPNADINEIIDD